MNDTENTKRVNAAITEGLRGFKSPPRHRCEVTADRLGDHHDVTCPSTCDDDCDVDCHEWHAVGVRRRHDPYTCPGATVSGLRRDLETEADRLQALGPQ